MMRMRAWALSALGASLALLCVCALTVREGNVETGHGSH